eukprot:6220373-Prorocentrum_lima.AAC.1
MDFPNWVGAHGADTETRTTPHGHLLAHFSFQRRLELLSTHLHAPLPAYTHVFRNSRRIDYIMGSSPFAKSCVSWK